MRRLTPDEAALWRRVAGSVRAIKGQTANPRSVRPELVEACPERLPQSASQRALSFATKGGLKKEGGASTGSTRTGPKPSQATNTLDGSWDRKIGTGRVTPERTIDLHGYTAAAAHHRLERGLDDAIRDGMRVILLITGRAPRRDASRIDLPLRGIIRSSVGDWLAASRHAGSVAAVRNAHPRHGGAGALYIVLRRPR
jgi:DNA-nicking Smr family endonuclease